MAGYRVEHQPDRAPLYEWVVIDPNDDLWTACLTEAQAQAEADRCNRRAEIERLKEKILDRIDEIHTDIPETIEMFKQIADLLGD